MKTDVFYDISIPSPSALATMLGIDIRFGEGNLDTVGLGKGTRGSAPAQMTKSRGGMREPKEGVTMSHAFQAPFHGVGGYTPYSRGLHHLHNFRFFASCICFGL